jgi:hypothetical protein
MLVLLERDGGLCSANNKVLSPRSDVHIGALVSPTQQRRPCLFLFASQPTTGESSQRADAIATIDATTPLPFAHCFSHHSAHSQLDSASERLHFRHPLLFTFLLFFSLFFFFSLSTILFSFFLAPGHSSPLVSPLTHYPFYSPPGDSSFLPPLPYTSHTHTHIQHSLDTQSLFHHMAPVFSLPLGLHKKPRSTLAGISFLLAYVILRRQQTRTKRRARRAAAAAAAATAAGRDGSTAGTGAGAGDKGGVKARRVGVDKHFLDQLKKLLPICIPGFASKEAGLLAALATILIAR